MKHEHTVIPLTDGMEVHPDGTLRNGHARLELLRQCDPAAVVMVHVVLPPNWSRVVRTARRFARQRRKAREA